MQYRRACNLDTDIIEASVKLPGIAKSANLPSNQIFTVQNQNLVLIDPPEEEIKSEDDESESASSQGADDSYSSEMGNTSEFSSGCVESVPHLETKETFSYVFMN